VHGDQLERVIVDNRSMSRLRESLSAINAIPGPLGSARRRVILDSICGASTLTRSQS